MQSRPQRPRVGRRLRRRVLGPAGGLRGHLMVLSTAGAVARLLGEEVARSARFYVPLLLYTAVVGALLSGDQDPLPVPWVGSALLLYPVSAWLTHCLAETEDDVQRMVTVSSAGGPVPVTVGVLMAAGFAVSVLSMLALVWGTVASFGSATVGSLFGGLCAHLASGFTGIAVGMVCSRPLIGHVGRATLGGLTIVTVTGTQSWLPPVGTAVASLGSGRGGMGPFGDLLLAMVLAVAAATLVVQAGRGQPLEWAERLAALRQRFPGQN